MFVDRGSTGSAAIWWGTPGGGGRGNEAAGQIDQQAPGLDGADGAAPAPDPGATVPPGGKAVTEGTTTLVYGPEGGLVAIRVVTDTGTGRRTVTTTTYDGQGRETGKTIVETTDDGEGHRTTTTITYDGSGHETGRTVVNEQDDGAGHTTRTTTTTDAQGHVTDQKTETLAATSAKGWVIANTWHATVTRSFISPLVGNNGTYYLTAAAAARLIQHEQQHIANSKTHHDAFIAPLEDRTRLHETQPKALWYGKVKAAAIGKLNTFIDWAASIQKFVDADTADNRPPNGTVDTNDLASGTYPVDRGARIIGGTNYDHYIDVP